MAQRAWCGDEMSKLNVLEKENLQSIIDRLDKLCEEICKNGRDELIQGYLEKILVELRQIHEINCF